VKPTVAAKPEVQQVDSEDEEDKIKHE